MIRIEQALEQDIEGIAYVHTESWKTTYRGLISDEFLNPITQERGIKQWSGVFSSFANKEIRIGTETKSEIAIGWSLLR